MASKIQAYHDLPYLRNTVRTRKFLLMLSDNKWHFLMSISLGNSDSYINEFFSRIAHIPQILANLAQ